MATQDLPKPDHARNMTLIGHSDQGGRPDGVQLMVNKGHAFIGHMFSKGFSVVDVRNPRDPKPVAYVAAPHNTWNIHLQTIGDLLLVVNAKEAGRLWLPGMNSAAGETPSWPPTRRYGLHHATVNGDTAYAAWRDAGLVVIDVADRSKPKLIVHRNWSPPFGGGTHNILALPDRDLLVVVIRDKYRPTETASFVPPAPKRLVDHRPNRPLVIQSCDVFVDKEGLVY